MGLVLIHRYFHSKLLKPTVTLNPYVECKPVYYSHWDCYIILPRWPDYTVLVQADGCYREVTCVALVEVTGFTV